MFKPNRKQNIDDNEKQIIYNKIREGKGTSSSIAKEYNISRQRLAQIIGNTKMIKPIKEQVPNAMYNKYVEYKLHLEKIHGIKTELVIGKNTIHLVLPSGKTMKCITKDINNPIFYASVVHNSCDYIFAMRGDAFYFFRNNNNNKRKGYYYLSKKNKNKYDALIDELN